MLAFLFLAIVVGSLVYIGWRLTRAYASRPSTRTIGPDDDPDFLWRMGNDENKPR